MPQPRRRRRRRIRRAKRQQTRRPPPRRPQRRKPPIGRRQKNGPPREAAKQRAAQEAAQAKAAKEKAAAEAQAARNNPAGAKAYAEGALASFGWGAGELGCLETLWHKESEWDLNATNPSSGAYGIPQALPGNKMAAAGADWQTNVQTQVDRGLGYIESRYGSTVLGLELPSGEQLVLNPDRLQIVARPVAGRTLVR